MFLIAQRTAISLICSVWAKARLGERGRKPRSDSELPSQRAPLANGRMLKPCKNPNTLFALKTGPNSCSLRILGCAMDPAASAPEIDLTEGDQAHSSDFSKGHTPEGDIWAYFNKQKLSKAEALKLHRNYDAACKACGTSLLGKPQQMKRHLVDCSKANPSDQRHALTQQAKPCQS